MLLRIAERGGGKMGAGLTRFLDISFAVSGLILLAPFFLLALISAAIWDPGPLFFRQERVGGGGRLVKITKLRTLPLGSHDVQPDIGEVFITTNQANVSQVGKILRRSSIDEYPQLVSVLMGDLSLVGPRPCLPREKSEIVARGFGERFSVPAGLTGLAQVKGRKRLTTEETLSLDIYWVKNRSLALYLQVALITPIAMVRGTGAH